jgi:hypothetical protein
VNLLKHPRILIAVALSTLLLYATLEFVRRLVNEIYRTPEKKHNVTRLI